MSQQGVMVSKAPWCEVFLVEGEREALKWSAGLPQHPALIQLQPCSQSSCALFQSICALSQSSCALSQSNSVVPVLALLPGTEGDPQGQNLLLVGGKVSPNFDQSGRS